MEDDADEDVADDDAGAVPCPWPGDAVQADTTATAVATKASGKRRKRPVMISPPVR
jgi:hypothetical protein